MSTPRTVRYAFPRPAPRVSVRESLANINLAEPLPAPLERAIKEIRNALHELAQPLAVITGTIDLLMLELDQHSEIFQDVKNISDQLEHILTIIDDIRSVARQISPNGGSKVAQPESTSPSF